MVSFCSSSKSKKVELAQAPSNKKLFRKGDDPKKSLQNLFLKSKFITAKYEKIEEDQKERMALLIRLIQKHGDFFTENTRKILKFYFELDKQEFEKLIELSKHRRPNLDAFFNQLYTKSIQQFCKSIEIDTLLKDNNNILKDNLAPLDTEKEVHSILVNVIQAVHKSHQLTKARDKDKVLYFNLCDLDLTGIVLHQLVLPAEFSLSGSCFDGAKLLTFTFTGCNIKSASFIGATLSGGSFIRTPLDKSNFNSANLAKITFDSIHDTDEDKTRFVGTIMTAVRIINCHFQNSDFTEAYAEGTTITSSSFTKVNFTGTILSGATIDSANFTSCQLSGCLFDGATIQNSNFIANGVQSEDVSFARTILNNVTFRDMDVSTFDFSRPTPDPQNAPQNVPTLTNVTFINCTFGPQHLVQLIRFQMDVTVVNPTVRSSLSLYPQGAINQFLEPRGEHNILDLIDLIPNTNAGRPLKIGFFRAFFEQLNHNLTHDLNGETRAQILAEKSQFLSFFFGRNPEFLDERFLDSYILPDVIMSAAAPHSIYTIREEEDVTQLFDSFLTPHLLPIQTPMGNFYDRYSAFVTHLIYLCLVRYPQAHRAKGVQLATHYYQNMAPHVRDTLPNFLNDLNANILPKKLFFASADRQRVAVVTVPYYQRYILRLPETEITYVTILPRNNLDFEYFVTQANPNTNQLRCIPSVNFNVRDVPRFIPVFNRVFDR